MVSGRRRAAPVPGARPEGEGPAVPGARALSPRLQPTRSRAQLVGPAGPPETPLIVGPRRQKMKLLNETLFKLARLAAASNPTPEPLFQMSWLW